MTMKKPHYAWLVCAGCALLLFCTSGLTVNAFTIYQPFLLRQGNLTNAQSSMLITIRNLFSFLGMLLTAWYYRKLTLRTGMLLSGLMVGFSFLVWKVKRLVGLASGFQTRLYMRINWGCSVNTVSWTHSCPFSN